VDEYDGNAWENCGGYESRYSSVGTAAIEMQMDEIFSKLGQA
jgi:hypothetical protein